ncbi:MAG: DNA repair protein RadA [Patescibacteria group bacterium]
MSKISNIYVCASCDAQFSKWSGRCLDCGAWGTLQRQTIDEKDIIKNLAAETSPAEVINLEKIENKGFNRLKTNILEIDRVFGNGLVPGSLILLAGEPGIGKSTIVAQIAQAVGQTVKSEIAKIIYVSGEESAGQIKSRLTRLNCDLATINFIGEVNVEKILSAIIKIKPELVIIDSIQTVYSSLIPTEAGSLNQIRASAVKFLELAKEHNITVILIGHITKDGQIAGPKALEHIVDTVIYLESETTHNYRILRATKNRFGSINEIGVFEMSGAGFKEISNPGAVFLEANKQAITGSVISSVIEGTRPFLVEIQALVTKTVFGYPQRKSSGFDLNRLQVIAAVLTKRAQINLINQDVILNIVGGLKASDPALDLAVCTAIASSLLNQVVDRKIIILGEVGLGGEVRKVNKLEQRLAEAEKLGFLKAIIPDEEVKVNSLSLIKITNLSELVATITRK